MPSNIISLNNSPEYDVPDSKMEELIEWLLANAFPLEEDAKFKLRGKRNLQVAYND